MVLLALGAKTGVALAGLLLAANNVAKVIAYRHTLPLRPITGVLVATALGAYIGARLMVAAPAVYFSGAVIAAIGCSFLAEQAGATRLARLAAPVLALGAGITSDFAGTSGPLKGLALRAITGNRQQLAGAASAVSLTADLTKVGVYLNAALLSGQVLWIGVSALPVIPVTAALGFRLNREVGERAFRLVFWSVMLGYSVRLVVLLTV